MNLTAWFKSVLLTLILSVGLVTEVLAHNAVTSISEEDIAIGFIGIIILAISLVCAILGLFKTHKFIRVFAIIGAVSSSLISVFVTMFRGFEYFIPMALVFTILLWLAVYSRKSKEVMVTTPSALKMGVMESMVFLVSSMFITRNLHNLMPQLEMRSTILYILLALVALIIIYFGHRHYFKKLSQNVILPTFSDGMKVSAYSIIVFSVIEIIHSMLMGLAQDYGSILVLQILKVLAIGSLPVLVIGALVSYVITPKSTTIIEE
ncbi:MAG: hypothetical protein AB8B53_02700 [Flavobacteriales bacterium]